MNLQLLQELDLTAGQIKVYTAVLELGISTINKIHEKTGIERRNIYDILNKLIERGLISYTSESGKRTYQCTPPQKIMEEIRQKEMALQKLREELPQIKELYQLSRPEIGAEVYRGNEGIKTLLNEILEYNESYWLGGNSFENYTAVPKSLLLWWEQWMMRRVEKKHYMYDLVSYGTWLKGLEPPKIQEHKKKYYQYHSLPKDLYSPLVIIIFGNKVAQVVWGEQSFAFILDSKKIRDSFKKYFDYLWRSQK